MRRIIAAGVFVAVWGASLAAQRTLLVPGQYATIGAAVQAAQTNDTVLVSPGIYRETFWMRLKMTVRSTGGPFVTIIDGQGLGPVVSISCEDSVFEGFTVTNGAIGIALDICGNGFVRNNRIIGNSARYSGGGIYTSGSAFHITGNYIAGNSAQFGGGIYTGASGGWTKIYRNVITRNTCSLDGGGINGSPANWNASIFENVISYNSAGRDGGGIHYQAWNTRVVNNIVVRNDAGRNGGGIYREMQGSSEIGPMAHCTVAYNRALGSGGGLFVSSGPPHRVEDSIFWGNQAPVGPEIVVGQTGFGWTNFFIDHSVVQGGLLSVQVTTQSTLHWGPSMLTSDPLFVDQVSDDFHLRADSPVRNKAMGSTLTNDFEGDPRPRPADIGADQVAPHLYVVGTPRPGSVFSVRVVGRFGGAAYLAVSPALGRRSPPLTFPGVTGAFEVPDPFVIIPIGMIPATGVVSLPLKLPASFPIPTPFVVQALSGTTLTNTVDLWIH